ncbi:MAG: type VI secretion system-associated FHA domain protein [Pseudomonadota bacterium]
MKEMHGRISADALAGEIRDLFRSDPSRAEVLLEHYVEEQLQDRPLTERLDFLGELIGRFKAGACRVSLDSDHAKEVSQLLSQFLGKSFALSELSSADLLEKLAQSLNTVFDAINNVVGGIRGMLLGENSEIETIRLIIGSHLQGKRPAESLESYCGQIRETFSLAHRAFQEAATTRVREVLAELDPAAIEKEGTAGLKFGPLRKAEFFQVYKERYSKCKEWFESGRFNHDLLREFERVCQEQYHNAKT